MKKLLILIFIFVFSISHSQLAVIQDKDGYTNVRKEKSSDSQILYKIIDGEYFYYEPNKSNDWFKVTNMNGDFGFMHKSRIKEIKEINIKDKKYKTSEIKLKIQKKTIGKIKVEITQVINVLPPEKIKDDFYYCHSFVDIYFPNKHIQNFEYNDIQPLGGYAGITFLDEVVSNYLILIKLGDYDGKTIIIDYNGNVTEMGGGSVSNIIDNKYIISFAECDLGVCGLSVFNLNTGKVDFTYDYEVDVYTLEDKIILDLESENNFRVLNLESKLLENIQIEDKNKLVHFADFIPYKPDCLCN